MLCSLTVANDERAVKPRRYRYFCFRWTMDLRQDYETCGDTKTDHIAGHPE